MTDPSQHPATAAIAARPAELRISVAVGAAFIVQSAFALIWAGGAAERINQLEARVDASQMLIVRTARLEEQVKSVRTTLIRIEEKIDQNRENAQ
ncbi:MAG: hypothetical protein AAFY22_14140 [Pseudomonadota bacterium]